MTTYPTSPICVPLLDLERQHAPLVAELRAAFDRVLSSSAFILGDEVEHFEAEFAEYCGTAHCVGVGSGTAALTIMLLAAGIGRGDEVIVPAHTFIATALAVMHAGATPVCVDVDPGTGLIDPEAARAAVGPATAAILAVHLYGQACSMDPLRALAEQHGLALFEDAAQAHGSTYRGVRAGGLAHASAFSFYPSKNLGALGDGGAICTDDGELAERARQYRDLGRGTERVHAVAGFNERLDGLQAALLRVKLPYVDDWIAARRTLAGEYCERLQGAVVELLEEHDESPCTYHLLPIRVDDRHGLANELAARGIACGVHYSCALPDQPALSGLAAADVPVARDWAARELSLPLFAEMRPQELASVAAAVTELAGLPTDRRVLATGVGHT